jgi:hypothetical protein
VTDDEFLQMIPAALELLMRRLQVWDRKALHGAAMICAEQWNIVRDRKLHPDPLTATDFLPELPEERARREAEEEVLRTAPETSPHFARFKANLSALAEQTPAQKAAQAALAKRLATGND